MRVTATVIVTVLLLAPPSALALDDPSGPDETSIFVADTDALASEQLRRGLEAADGTLLRTDETLGIAVLDVAEPEAFVEETGAELVADPGLELSVGAPGAEVPQDTYLGLQWGPLELNAPQAWSILDPVLDATVAIVDTGIDAGHGDLAEERITYGTDYIEDDGVPQDEDGHGTHVAGIVAATRDNDRGVAGMVQTELYVTRVISGDEGRCSYAAMAIVESVDAGADVINLSLHCAGHFDPLHDAVDYATDNGAVVVAAAGNDQLTSSGSCIPHPAVHGSVIAVGASDPTMTPAAYSCQGNDLELLAPGTFVLSTVDGGGYGLFTGTSMATPHVSATAAMLVDQHPSWTGSEIRQRLRQTARDLGTPGYDPYHGYGLVDPVAALTGLPVHVPSTFDEEIETPFGAACVNADGDAGCEVVAVAGTGNATTGMGYLSASGTGDASACSSVVGDGNVQILPTCLAVSGTGDATGSQLAATGTGDAQADAAAASGTGDVEGCVGVSGTGQAEGTCTLFGLEPALSGCETGQQAGIQTLCGSPGDGDRTRVGPACASLTSDVRCPWIAVSAGGDATTGAGGFLSASGTGDAEGCAAVSGTGEAEAWCALLGTPLGVSGCQTPPSWAQPGAVCGE